VSKSKKDKQAEKAPVAVPAVAAEQKPAIEVSGPVAPQGAIALHVGDEEMFTLYENTIQANIGGFMVVGLALKLIKDEQLHKVKYKELSFEEYCRERWDLSDKHAYRLIDAYTCVDKLGKELSPIGETRFPTNESQVRPLMALEPDEQVKAWRKVLKACKGKPITAIEVQEVVSKLLGKPANEKAAQPKTSLKIVEQRLVKIGELVTKALEEDESKLTVPALKQLLVKIQELIGAKK